MGEQKANILWLAILIHIRESPSERHKLRIRASGVVRIRASLQRCHPAA